jgi:predicted nucleic acid-binding Zn ribbon protein
MTSQELIDAPPDVKDRRIIVFKNERQEQVVRNYPSDGSHPSLRAFRTLCQFRRLNGFDQNECPVCSKKHVVLRMDDKYCSNACRQKAYRQRVKEQNRIASLSGEELRAHKKQERAKQQKLEALRNEIALHISGAHAKCNGAAE